MTHADTPAAVPAPAGPVEDVEEVDLLVVGGGKAGKSLAMLRAKAGDKVVMVERDKVGGTCINVACIPTKTLISAAQGDVPPRGFSDGPESGYLLKEMKLVR